MPREGNKAAVRRLVKQGWRDVRIAERLGISRPAVAAHRKAMGLRPNRVLDRWTEEEKERLRELREQGAGYREIARHLTRSVCAVAIALRRYGAKAVPA